MPPKASDLYAAPQVVYAAPQVLSRKGMDACRGPHGNPSPRLDPRGQGLGQEKNNWPGLGTGIFAHF